MKSFEDGVSATAAEVGVDIDMDVLIVY